MSWCGTLTAGRQATKRIAEVEGADQVGVMWTLLTDIAAVQTNPTLGSLTPDEGYATQWMQDILNNYEVTSAQKALDEYNSWKNLSCNYVTPSTNTTTGTSIFSYKAADDPYCTGTQAGLFAGLTPPTYENFLEYGSYDASQSLNLGRVGVGAGEYRSDTRTGTGGAGVLGSAAGRRGPGSESGGGRRPRDFLAGSEKGYVNLKKRVLRIKLKKKIQQLDDAIQEAKDKLAGGEDTELDIPAAELEAEELEEGFTAIDEFLPEYIAGAAFRYHRPRRRASRKRRFSSWRSNCRSSSRTISTLSRRVHRASALSSWTIPAAATSSPASSLQVKRRSLLQEPPR